MKGKSEILICVYIVTKYKQHKLTKNKRIIHCVNCNERKRTGRSAIFLIQAMLPMDFFVFQFNYYNNKL